MFAKLKEKTTTIGSQKSPLSNQEKGKPKSTNEDHLQSINEAGVVTSPDSHGTLAVPGKMSRQSSVSSLVSDNTSMVSASQFINDSPMPNIDNEVGTFDLEESAFPQLSSDLSPQDVYSSLVRESRQKLNSAKFKYQDLLAAYRELEKQHAKIKDALAKSQDRAFKKIAEIKESEKGVRLELDKCQERLNALEQEKLTNEAPKEEVNLQQARIAELEAALATRTSEEATLKLNTDRLSSLITSVQSEKTKLEEGMKLATEKAMELKKQLSEKETIHSLAIAECKRNFHTLLEERDAELKNCRLQVEHVRAETETAKRHAQELTAVINSLKAENATVRVNLEVTERRLDAEKIQLVQEVSKAKDAVCEALQLEFEKKTEERRKILEGELEKKMQDFEISCHRKYAESLEQSKLALEESWLAKKAADSKHEQEMEVAQTRMSQMSVELDSTRMTLHRRTLEADQLRSAQEHLTMQSTADIEQAVAHCRREIETKHREEVKQLRETFENQQREVRQSDESKRLTDQKSAVESVWSLVKAEFDNSDISQPEIASYPEIIEFLLQNSAKLSKCREEIGKARESSEQEIKAIRSSNDSMQQKLAEQANQILAFEAQGQLTTNSELADEVSSLRKQLEEATNRLKSVESQNGENLQHESDDISSMAKRISEKNSQIQSLEINCEQLKNEVKQAESLFTSNEELKIELAEKSAQIEMLTAQNSEMSQQISIMKSFQDSVDLLNQQLAQKNDENQLLKHDLENISSLQFANDHLQQQLADKVRQIEALETEQVEKSKLDSDEMTILRSTNDQLVQENAQKNEQIQSLECQCHQLERELEESSGSFKSCNDALETQLCEKVDQVVAMEKSNEQLKAELDAARTEIENGYQRLSKIIPEDVTGLGNAVDFVFESYTSLQNQLESAGREKDSFSNSLESLRNELSQLEMSRQQASKDGEQRIVSLTLELNNCKAKLDEETKLKQSTESESRSRIADLEGSLQDLTCERQVLLQQLRNLEKQLETEQSESHKLAEEFEVLRKEHKQKVAESAQREKQLTDERTRLSEEMKASAIEMRRLETKLNVLETELVDSTAANQAANGRYREDVQQANKKAEDLKGKCATLEMDLVECRQKMTLSQELVGKLKSELDSARKSTEEAQAKFGALKTQSAKRLKLLGDEKCELEKQLASSLSENDALKSSLAANDKVVDPGTPSIADLEQTIADLTTRIDAVSKAVADKEIRIAELELELSDSDMKHSAEISRVTNEHEKAHSDAEQRIRFEMKRVISDFEHQLVDRDKQIARLAVVESTRTSTVDPERQVRSLERELSEKNAAVEQLVVMYEKQLRDQAADLRQEATSRMQSQSEKHQAEIDGLMDEFRNETKQWVVERQHMNEEIEQTKRDREQMVQELKRLSDLLDSARVGAPNTPTRNRSANFESPYFTPTQSSVLAGSTASPSLGPGMALQLHEATEYEYLRNILLEFMMGRETQILWRVIGTIMRFSDDQMTEIAARQDAKHSRWL